MYRSILLGIIFLLLSFYPAYSKTEQKKVQINHLKVSTEGTREKLELHFESTFEEGISFLFDPGFLKVIFPYTSFKSEISKYRINNQFIRNIRLRKEGANTILEIQFADSQFEPIGRITKKHDNNIFILFVDRKNKNPEENQDKTSAITPEESNIFGDIWDKPQEPEATFSNDFGTNSIIKMLLVLFFLLLCFYAMLWVYKRYFMSRFRYNTSRYDIKIVSSFHIGPKQKILIMQIDGSVLAVGVTQNSINVISKITDNSFSDFLSLHKQGEEDEVDFAELRQEYKNYKNSMMEKEIQEEREPSKHGFADELLNRIKKMKPIA